VKLSYGIARTAGGRAREGITMHVALLAAAVAVAAALLAADPAGAQARNQIRIVGSSTVFPYAQAAAEQFAGLTGARATVVEATGTGGGMKAFCAGVGTRYPDITGASRPMVRSEYDDCHAHGVDDISEILLGYDGLSIAHARTAPEMDVTRAELFAALAAEVEVDGAVVENPYRRWSEIDPALPDIPIIVFGPPPTSGTRDAFVELAMHAGCAAFPAIAALPEPRHQTVCSRMRQDGPFIEAGENDNIIVQRLLADPSSLGIFGYSFLYENSDRLRAAKVDGVLPTPETIASGAYAVSRPLFVYVKNAHRGVIPGLDDFLAEFLSEEALGPEGYLPERGLVPLALPERKQARDALAAHATMTRFD
jgi:phosphate transport system substrate-binding protein